MRFTSTWTALLLAGVVLPGTAGAASAVFYDADTGAYGYSMNQRTVSAALQQSLGYCVQRSPNCSGQASTTGPGFSALYTGTHAVGYALSEKDDAAAQRKAEAMCRRKAADCQLALLWREDTPAPLVQRVPRPRFPTGLYEGEMEAHAAADAAAAAADAAAAAAAAAASKR
ncbi:hypothetical protein D3C87_477040 [compost metagenome]